MNYRYALVSEKSDASTVARYLPDNYALISSSPRGHVIAGQDDAGWTLDGYVIPRLASGLHWAREIKGTKLTIVHSEVAMHTRTAGLDCHVIEEDTFYNGNLIPEDARFGCWVIVPTPPGVGQIPMLKSEAGWLD